MHSINKHKECIFENLCKSRRKRPNKPEPKCPLCPPDVKGLVSMKRMTMPPLKYKGFALSSKFDSDTRLSSCCSEFGSSMIWDKSLEESLGACSCGSKCCLE